MRILVIEKEQNMDSSYLTYTNASPELAMMMANLYTGVMITDYDEEIINPDSKLIYPLDAQGLRITMDNETIDCEHLDGFTVLGPDLVIIIAICSLYRDKLIPALVFNNFLASLQDETVALPFVRVRDVFICSDLDLSPLIQNRVQELRALERWEGLHLEYDPNYELQWDAIDNFIRDWFHEVTCFKVKMRAGTKSFFWVFRVPVLPCLNLEDSDTIRNFILSNYSTEQVRVPFHLKLEPSSTPYFYLKLRYAISFMNHIKVEELSINSNYFTIPCTRNKVLDVIASLNSDQLETIIAKVNCYPSDQVPLKEQSKVVMKLQHHDKEYSIVM